MNQFSSICSSCGGAFKTCDGPIYDYMTSSPGCWAAYGEVLAREYENPALFAAVHRQTVDAYALQHPGDLSDRRAAQSVWVHYVAMFLTLDKKWTADKIIPIMKGLVKEPIPVISQRQKVEGLTHAHVLEGGIEQHEERVKAWAEVAYKEWEALKPQVISVFQKF